MSAVVNLWRYVLERIASAIVAIFGVIIMTFVIIHLIPGNPILNIIPPEHRNDARLVASVTQFYGFDKPLYVQLLTYIWNFLHGDLGFSSFSYAPVISDIRLRLPATTELTVFAIVIALGIAIPVGIVSATRRGSFTDHIARVFSIIGVSAPSFWWGTIFLIIFYLQTGLVSGGRLSPQLTPPPFVTGSYLIDSLLEGNLVVFGDALKHLILPALTLGLTGNATMMRLTRSSMLEILNSDYIAMARMKGLSERIVIYKHAFRNAVIPTFTYAGLLFGGMLGGAVLVETVFTWPGIGTYIVNAILNADFQAVVSTTFVMAVIFTIMNLLVDLMYGFLDPRVRV